jgi:hypothetical protein
MACFTFRLTDRQQLTTGRMEQTVAYRSVTEAGKGVQLIVCFFHDQRSMKVKKIRLRGNISWNS